MERVAGKISWVGRYDAGATMALQPSPIHVDHFARNTRGGAGIAARRIAKAVAAAGASVRIFHHPSENPDPELDCLTMTCSGSAAVGRELRRPFYYAWWGMHLFRRPKGLSDFSPVPTYVRGPCPGPAGNPRILHLHWIGRDLFDWKTFLAPVPMDTPIVWTLHDANPVTGGCHYPEQCRKYQAGCGTCPQLGRAHARDISAVGLRMKMDALRGRPLHLVAPSSWSETIARESALGRMAKTIRRAPLPVDCRVFRPLPRDACRKELGIPPEAAVIAFGADDLAHRIKGFDLLRNALRLLARREPTHVVTYGRGDPAPFATPGIRIHAMGYINSPERFRSLLSAANLFVLPSREECCGQTGLEAMACGLPVAAFRTGGIPDYVVPGQTGFLADEMDGPGLARQLDGALANPKKLAAMGRNARALIEGKHDTAVAGAAYLDIYREIQEKSHE